MNRVMVVGPFGPGQLPASLANALERLGCEVVRFDSDRAYQAALPGAAHRLVRRLLRPALWRRVSAATLALVKQSRPDVVLTVKAAYLDPATVRSIRQTLGVPIVNYYSDNPYCGVPWNPRQPSAQRRDLITALREYTRVWVWERSLAARLIGDGVHAGYLPFGADPECTPAGGRGWNTTPSYRAVFVGQHSDKREAHIDAVRGHSVAVWGSRWRRATRRFGWRHLVHTAPAFGRQAAEIYAKSATCLNVLDDLNMPGHNMRTFEIPASGGLMLSTFTPEQAELFPEDEAAMYYRDPVEIGEKINRALRDREWSGRLRSRALAIAAGHSYSARMTTVLEDLRQ